MTIKAGIAVETPFGRRLVALAAAAAVLAAACSGRPPEKGAGYAAGIAADRAAKDAAFMENPDPIPDEKKAEFLPLAYFPIDPDYAVPAALAPSDDATVVEMPTSTGTIRKLRRAGMLEFVLKGQPLALMAFVEPGANTLFVPFSDMTSGTETYAAGRFMDLAPTANNVYVVDFNKAYIPYCYYNFTYECPYPPPENRLDIPIRAGERMKKRG
ncbi:MAG: DUF1684 domain-containing protein [Acidobacteria bacterium]|nr:DUF1684 domain-containing protein [Acidobacteriota bacterium]